MKNQNLSKFFLFAIVAIAINGLTSSCTKEVDDKIVQVSEFDGLSVKMPRGHSENEFFMDQEDYDNIIGVDKR